MSDDPKPRGPSKSVFRALIIAGVQIGGALLLTFARTQGLIDEETATRGVMVLIGLGLAVYGNTMPKTLDGLPPPTRSAAALRQSISRVGGWALMLGGLAYASLWAFAPRDVALVGCIVAVGTAILVMFGYAAWLIATRRSPTS